MDNSALQFYKSSFQKVVARSLEIWGDEEAMEEERDRRMNARDKKKQKQFDKKVKGEHHLCLMFL